MQTTRPAPRGRVGGRHVRARREYQNRWPHQDNWSRVRERVPPTVELLFLLGVVVPLVGTVCAVCGALGLLAALWTVTVT